MAESDGVFRALLRSWRNQRGMSQLDLGLAADVSARHVSFLETGRSRPSVEMVMLLSEVLDVPLRERNDMLRAAGFNARYAEPGIDELLASSIGTALDVVLEHYEPFPVMVFDRQYDVVKANRSASRLFDLVGVDLTGNPNLLRVVFAPFARELVDQWELLAGDMLRRAQRELLQRPNDDELAALLAEVLETPGVPDGWRTPDLTEASDPVVPLTFRIGESKLSLLGMITCFSAPSNVTLDELQIESWLPLDDETKKWFFDAAT